MFAVIFRQTRAPIWRENVLAAVCLGAARAAIRTSTRALAPRNAAGGCADLWARTMGYALLAPNPHNRQPWLAQR